MRNLPSWSKLIQSGKKTPEDIIKTVQSKCPMTTDQIAKIRAIKKDAPIEPVPIEGEFMSHAEVEAIRQREMQEAQQ